MYILVYKNLPRNKSQEIFDNQSDFHQTIHQRNRVIILYSKLLRNQVKVEKCCGKVKKLVMSLTVTSLTCNEGGEMSKKKIQKN